MRQAGIGVVVALMLAVMATGAVAQETGTPVFKAPYRAFNSYEFGGNISFPSGAPDFALEGFYSYGHGSYDLGIRGGFENVPNGDTRVLLGADFRTRVLNASDRFPLDGALTLGLGLNAGSGPDVVYIPVGLSLGRRFLLEGSKTSFVPYVQPVVVPALSSGNSNLDFALGFGVDIRFSNTVDFRVSAGVGDIEGLSLGVAFVR
ncbi:MAG TPA: hypothetical protein VIE46_07265 [Gemmatimonadales bacterium]